MRYRVRHSSQFFPGEIWPAAVLSALCLLIPANVVAQLPGPPKKPANPIQQTVGSVQTMEGEQGAAIRVTVLAGDKKQLARQAVVKLFSEARQTTNWQTTNDRSETIFEDLPFGKYDIEAGAAGYLSNHKEVEVVNLVDTVQVQIVLERDPSAAEMDNTDASMSPKARQETIHAVKALNSGDLKEAQKWLDEAEQLSPSSARLKFLCGYMFLQKGDLERAQTYLSQATALHPHYAQALTLLGRVQLLRGHNDQAQTTLTQAIAADPEQWTPHNLLADVFLQQHEYEKAREQAQFAIDKGKREGTAAQLALGEALANLGRTSEAIQALKTFLESQPKSAAAPHAQALLKELEQRRSGATAASDASLTEAASFAVATDVVASDTLNLQETSWQPPGIDSVTGPVAAGVSCPYEKVVEEAGRRVEQLVADVARFAAVDALLHERLDEIGNPVTRETRKFDYAASMYQTQPGVVQVDEYRSERYGLDDLPDQFADNGFAALALVFHPAMRDAFRMSCEGLGDWHGQPTWLVRFQQRDDRPNHMQAYLLGTARYAVSLKGRAWITADKFQIARIETEMVRPLPQIRLLAEHQITEYGPVVFPKKNVELWLPKTAEVYMDFRGHRYYRKHTFEKYMLFSVESEEKIHEAKHDSTGPGSTSPRRHRSSPS